VPAAIDCETGDGDPDPENVEVIEPDKRVPEFRVATTECEVLDSERIMGGKPLVLVFFSSWCGVCDKKMPIIRAAIDVIGDEATFIAVALDDDDTWAEVGPFLDRHRVSMPLIRGDRFRRFSLGYNPFRSIPVVVVVGRDSVIVDLQVGMSPFDYNRLLGAVEIGKRRNPSRTLSSSRRDDAVDEIGERRRLRGRDLGHSVPALIGRKLDELPLGDLAASRLDAVLSVHVERIGRWNEDVP
jgi:thiol-disulfide isomerase/thioredoxin